MDIFWNYTFLKEILRLLDNQIKLEETRSILKLHVHFQRTTFFPIYQDNLYKATKIWLSLFTSEKVC